MEIIKSLLFKEWLKIRWTYLGMFSVMLATIIYSYLNISHTIELNGAPAFWEFVIYKKLTLGKDLFYIPLVTGILVAIVQYYPEINNGRLKLTLHLPVEERKILFTMVLLSGTLLLIGFLINLAIFGFVLAILLPIEVVQANLFFILPVFIAGLTAYFLTAAIMVEPVWSRRIPLIVFTTGILSYILQTGDFTNSLLTGAFIFALLSSITILLSGHYYKRGVK